MVSEVFSLPWDSLISSHRLVKIGWKLMPSHPAHRETLPFHLSSFWRHLGDAGAAVRTSSTSTVISPSEDFPSSFNHWFWHLYHLYLGALSFFFCQQCQKKALPDKRWNLWLKGRYPVVWTLLLLLWDWGCFQGKIQEEIFAGLKAYLTSFPTYCFLFSGGGVKVVCQKPATAHSLEDIWWSRTTECAGIGKVAAWRESVQRNC